MGSACPANAHGALFSDTAWECLTRRLKLSRREVQIAKAVIEDHKEQYIADLLGISEHTVHTHLQRLYRKLEINSRMELVLCLARCQMALIDEPDSELPPLCGRRSAGRCPLDPLTTVQAMSPIS